MAFSSTFHGTLRYDKNLLLWILVVAAAGAGAVNALAGGGMFLVFPALLFPVILIFPAASQALILMYKQKMEKVYCPKYLIMAAK